MAVTRESLPIARHIGLGGKAAIVQKLTASRHSGKTFVLCPLRSGLLMICFVIADQPPHFLELTARLSRYNATEAAFGEHFGGRSR